MNAFDVLVLFGCIFILAWAGASVCCALADWLDAWRRYPESLRNQRRRQLRCPNPRCHGADIDTGWLFKWWRYTCRQCGERFSEPYYMKGDER
jgi:hypothetical protein